MTAVFACQRSAEKVSVPSDERAFYWLQAMVSAGDVQRRAAVDAFLAGDDERAVQTAKHAEEKYTAAGELSQFVSATLQLNDEVWAELPYLARWITRTPLGDESPASADEQTDEILLTFWESSLAATNSTQPWNL